jgi:hypothetical protein
MGAAAPTIRVGRKSITNKNYKMNKRVKLVDLSDMVQAVLVKKQSDREKPAIYVTMYTRTNEADIEFSCPMEYKNEDGRDKDFENIKTEGLVALYNDIIEQTNLPEELIIQK